MALSVELNKSLPTNFRLAFPVLPAEVALDGSQELVLNIHTIILPGITLSPIELPWQGSKRRDAGELTFEDFTVNFIVDTQFTNWKVIYNWIKYISQAWNDDREKAMEQYYNYTVDATLQILDNFNTEILRVNFKNMWPQSMSEVQFSYRDREAVIESTAVFAYNYYEIE